MCVGLAVVHGYARHPWLLREGLGGYLALRQSYAKMCKNVVDLVTFTEKFCHSTDGDCLDNLSYRNRSEEPLESEWKQICSEMKMSQQLTDPGVLKEETG